MIYFLVNNDYHLIDTQMHANQFRKLNLPCALIRVPHALKLPTRANLFASETTISSPITSHRWTAAWWRYFVVHRELKKKITPTSFDTLIAYTEYELINHFLINQFKTAGARVLLLEDGGLGTYLPFSQKAAEKLKIKEQLIALMTRMLPGLRDTTFHKVNGAVFPWRPDGMIDALCVYRQLDICRSIPLHVVERIEIPGIVATKPGRVLFLNEDIYNYYQSEDAYLTGLSHILRGLCNGFSEVLFKFHPRENDSWKNRIKSLIAEDTPKVKIIDRTAPAEQILHELAPEALASYFATPLLNLEGTGIQPLYIYHLIPDLKDQPMFRQLTKLLDGWNYHFAPTWQEVRSGYQSGLKFSSNQNNIALQTIVKHR